MSSPDSSHMDYCSSEDPKESGSYSPSLPDDLWMRIVELSSLQQRAALSTTCRAMRLLEQKVRRCYAEVWVTGSVNTNIVFVDIKESMSPGVHRLTFQSDFSNRTELKHTGGRHISTINNRMPLEASRDFLLSILRNATTEFLHIGIKELKDLTKEAMMTSRKTQKSNCSPHPTESTHIVVRSHLKVSCQTC